MTRYTVATAQLTLLLNSTNLELADKIELDYLILESRQLSISVNDIPPDLTHMQSLDTDNQQVDSNFDTDTESIGTTPIEKARSDKSEKANTFQSFIASIIDPSVLFPNLMAASILALLNIATALAIASLIFSGPLVPFISMGIGMFLIATVVGGVAVPAASGYKAILSAPRGGQSPIFATMAAARYCDGWSASGKYGGHSRCNHIVSHHIHWFCHVCYGVDKNWCDGKIYSLSSDGWFFRRVGLSSESGWHYRFRWRLRRPF
jgi:hypothetical protein